MKKRTRAKRSPLKARPLRNPGQSLDEEIDRILDEKVLPYLLASLLAVLLAGSEWLRYWSKSPPHPVNLTVIAGVVIAYSTFKILRLRGRIRNLKLGRDGEKAVGQYLEVLREQGYRIFHDIVGDDFNLDHVILSTSGIFTVETKTYSKPGKGKAEVIYDGRKILIDGWETDNDILGQAAAQRQWLGEILKEGTGKRYPVRSVVVFPGWFVKQTGQIDSEGAWVLNPKALPKWIENEKRVLTKEKMMAASYLLTLHIRATA